MPVYPLLAVVWALVLVPPIVRRRVGHRAELAEFDRIRLCFVGSTATPSHTRDAVSAAPIRRSAAQRRRRVLRVIAAGMVATLVVALVVRTRLAWGMHLLIYDILIAYVALLAHAAREPRSDRHHAVRPNLRAVPPVADRPIRPVRLPAPMPARQPLPVLQAASR